MVMDTKKIILAACAVLAAAACVNKTHDFPESVPQDMTPYSSIMVALPDGHSFPQVSGISAWKIEGQGKEYTFTSQDGGNPAEFKLGEGEEPVCQIAYLLYPKMKIDSLYRGKFFLDIPDWQMAVKDGFDENLYICAGHKTGELSTLTPVVGALKFTIDQNDIHSCIIKAEGKAICGAVKIAMHETVRAERVEKSLSEVTVEGDLEKGSSYNAMIVADEYSAFDITLKNSVGMTVWEKTIPVFDCIPAGGTLDLGKLGNPDISSLALTMNTSEFAGYTLKSVVGYSLDGEKLFGGEYSDRFESGKAVTAKIFGLEPADYSSSQMWFVVTLENAQGDGAVIPILVDGFKIEKATEVKYDLGTIGSDRNSAPWYYPYVDKRLKPGGGYAFGEANTFLIQYKESSYCSTLDPDPSIPSSVTIDYRVRGDFFGAPRPDDVTFEWLEGYNDSTPAWGKYTMDRGKIYNCHKYEFTVDKENYKVTVTNTGAHAGSPILLMKKGGQVLWAWTFWNIAADGTRLKAVDFGGVKIANMDIGYCSEKIDLIIPKIQYIRASCNYYQWGRPMPTFSVNGAGVSFGEGDARNASKPRVPVYDKGALSVSEALQHPGYLIQNPYTKGQNSKDLNDWISDGVAFHKDLWGGDDKNSTGVKSIYDPCPKGWRVPDAKTFLNVFPQPKKAYSTSEYPQEDTKGYQGVYINGILFPTNGVIWTNVSSDGYVSQMAYSLSATATATDNARFWTNTYYGSDNPDHCYAFKADYQYKKLDNATVNADRTIAVDHNAAGRALPVRCQKDDDNR